MNDSPKAPLTAIIADDEPLARAYLKELLAAHPEINLVGEAANGLDTVKATQSLNPDILFLDIQMPKLNGFELIKILKKDGWVDHRQTTHGIALNKRLDDRTAF